MWGIEVSRESDRKDELIGNRERKKSCYDGGKKKR
jgi:hypothetical protein